jgi:hypothetical protein
MAGVLFGIACLEALHMDLCPDRYHVADARSFLNNRRIEFLPAAVISCYPKAIEMLFVLGLLFEPESTSASINASFLPLTALCLETLFRRLGGPAAGAFAVLWFASQVMVHKYATMGFVDMGAMFFGAAALLPLHRFLERRRTRDAALAGLFVGMATCCKITTGFLLVLPYCVALAFVGLTHLDRKATAVWKGTLAMGGVALLVYSPYMVRNWIGSGSPFAPTLAQYFPLRPEFGEALKRFQDVHPVHVARFLDRPLWSLQFFLEQIAYDGSSAALILPVTVPMLLVFAFWKKDRFVGFVALAAGLSLALYAMAGPQRSSRFATPLLPLYSGAAARVTWIVVERVRSRWTIVFAVGFALAASVVVLLGIHSYRGVYLHRPLLTKSARFEFLRAVDSTWPQLEFLNENLGSDDRVAFHKASVRWRFLKVPFSSASYWGPTHAEFLWLVAQKSNGTAPEQEFRSLMEKAGIDHILVSTNRQIFPMELFEVVKEWPDTLLLRLKV